MFHSRSFYISLCLGALTYAFLLSTSGFRIGSMFADFRRESDSFVDFLYYLPKSPVYLLIVLVFLSMFHNDEYNTGFTKNIMPLMNHKWMFILERYVFNLICATLILVVLLFAATIVQIINPLEHTATLPTFDYVLFTFMQLLFIGAAASIVTMLNHITRSRILIIIFSVIYSLMIFYMLENMIVDFLFKSQDILAYTMYQIAGTLPHEVSWEAYKQPLCIVICYTIVYNVIGYFAIRKRDI